MGIKVFLTKVKSGQNMNTIVQVGLWDLRAGSQGTSRSDFSDPLTARRSLAGTRQRALQPL